MTYQQRAIEFFTTTGEEWWMKSQVVEKLKELAAAPDVDQDRIRVERLDIQSDRLSAHDEILSSLEDRLERVEEYTQFPITTPEISFPLDDDAPPF